MTTQTDWTENQPHKKGATGMTYNTLNLHQQLRLVKFLESNIYQDGISLKTIADDATSDLGFVVTENNIKTTAKAAGVTLPSAKVVKPDQADELRAVIAALETRVEALERRAIGFTGTSDGLVMTAFGRTQDAA